MSRLESTLVPQRATSTVRALDDANAGQWTRFVTDHPDANLYQSLIWRHVIQEVFGHRPIYLVCEREGEVRGVLPLFLVRLPLLGSKLISLPYDMGSGGPLAADDEAEHALVERAVGLARELGVTFLEVRGGEGRIACERLGLERSEPVLLSELELDTEERAWARVKQNHRGSVQKAKKCGVTVRAAESLDDYRAFYEIYLRVFRDFGTPPYGANYFPVLWRRLHAGGHARLLLAEADRRQVGGLLLFCWGKNLVNKFSACLPEAAPLCAYAALYWRAIRLGLELGYRTLSLGTSARPQTGLVEFKERWGATTRPVVVYDLPVRGRPPALEGYYDGGGLARRLWKKLPVAMTPALGGLLNRWFC